MAIGIAEGVFIYYLNASQYLYNFTLFLGFGVCLSLLSLLVLYLNILSLMATIVFKRCAKEVMRKLSTIFLILAILTIVDLSAANIVASIIVML